MMIQQAKMRMRNGKMLMLFLDRILAVAVCARPTNFQTAHSSRPLDHVHFPTPALVLTLTTNSTKTKIDKDDMILLYNKGKRNI